jgi:hypothetical protein
MPCTMPLGGVSCGLVYAGFLLSLVGAWMFRRIHRKGEPTMNQNQTTNSTLTDGFVSSCLAGLALLP